MSHAAPPALAVTHHVHVRQHDVLTPDALAFVGELVAEFGDRVGTLLARREALQARIDAGAHLEFLPETEHVRRGDWKAAALRPDLLCRQVEITGPVDRKMVINGLNSGADVFMADFEDATSPTFANIVGGQVNLFDAVRRTIAYDDVASGRRYQLGERTATLMVRPRGWHLVERHLMLHGRPVPAALVDFGLFFFHNAHELLAAGSGPYFYLPKLEHHLEARLWNEIFTFAQQRLQIPVGSVRATVLIETLPAVFQMDEILYELREHAAGLNCGRWDYIFSYIKTFSRDPAFVLPDRAEITMLTPMMRAYSKLLIATCHHRGVHAMGGMAAHIPRRDDEEANRVALAAVQADKLREVTDGHDGTWVAHPGLIPLVREVFASHLNGPHQIKRSREEPKISADELLAVPEGRRTIEGLRRNIHVGIHYLDAWLRGHGCVPLDNLMEDAATAEICRAQVWQWYQYEVRFADHPALNPESLRRFVDLEYQETRDAIGERAFASSRFPAARDLFWALVTDPRFVAFLTLPAYERLPPV